jgi:hypothetical protein
MKTQSQHPPSKSGARPPVREPAEPKPAPVRDPDFPERHDDPDEAEELERQQDA